jgi:hypothetical protein
MPHAANLGKSGIPALHREPPHLKIVCNVTGDFENLKRVGAP